MHVEPVTLHEAASERYLHYALSVITSRALPDVRDGLKPVQRRILYTMAHELSLHNAGRYRKCAAVVGEVMGKYHPHGDTSIYDALVRMAQSFSLLHPLVDGQGNFGSLDGDPAAAMRYTECRLSPIAGELLGELRKRVVDVRPTYDGQRFEPIVLPAQFPNLLVNGCEGIAVGMATRIPPHNLREIVAAAIHLIDASDATVDDLLVHVAGPDFPTGGRIVATREELSQVYRTGQGSLKVQATWSVERDGRKSQVVLDSVPYGANKQKLVEELADHVREKRLPQVVDVRDESTDDVRVVLELRPGATPEEVMVWLFKRTGLQTTFPVNLTALVPTAGRSDVATPMRLDLVATIRHWLDFRFETVRRRLTYDLAELNERIHVLEGFARVFDALDEAIALIRASEGRRDAHERLVVRFDLSDLQADAVLELKLYRLARMELSLILEELRDKAAEAARLVAILASDADLWSLVRTELTQVVDAYQQPRRTIVGIPETRMAFQEDAYILDEDAVLVVTRDGWIKRQSSFTDLARIRVRDGDEISWLVRARTRTAVAFFGSQGGAFVLRVDDIPATSGHGEPVQRRFAFADGERVVGVVSFDARHLPGSTPAVGDDPAGPFGMALTQQGRVLRFPLSLHEEPSTRNGRKVMRLDEGDAVFSVLVCRPGDRVSIATRGGRAMVFLADDVSILKAAGKGVTGIKLRDGDQVMAFALSPDANGGVDVVTNRKREVHVSERAFGLSTRGSRGCVVLQVGSIDEWKRSPDVWLGPTDPAADAK